MSDLKKYLVEESTNEYLDRGDSRYIIEHDDSFFFAKSNYNKISFNDYIENDFTEFIDIISKYSNRETLYVKAIKNLLKQKEYVNLMYQLSNELISNEEFNNELDQNEDKYLIKIDQDLNLDNYKAIVEILENLKQDFTEDDVSEIFSLKTGFISKKLKNKSKREIEE